MILDAIVVMDVHMLAVAHAKLVVIHHVVECVRVHVRVDVHTVVLEIVRRPVREHVRAVVAYHVQVVHIINFTECIQYIQI